MTKYPMFKKTITAASRGCHHCRESIKPGEILFVGRHHETMVPMTVGLCCCNKLHSITNAAVYAPHTGDDRAFDGQMAIIERWAARLNKRYICNAQKRERDRLRRGDSR